MNKEFKNITLENIYTEHICCAISDKKHQFGVSVKKEWLKKRLTEGHVFRKLDVQGKVFIEYAPLETAWVPVIGENYLYIYCLWVSGSYKGKGYGRELLEYCINDAKSIGKAGICVLSAKKKKPFLSEKGFFQAFGFVPADRAGDYELLTLSFDGSIPNFTDEVKRGTLDSKVLTIYYGKQCPFIPNCIKEVHKFCKDNTIEVNLVEVDSLKKAKAIPCIFNNWAVFKNGKLETVTLLNEGQLKKLLKI